jgi:hypothetical protein
LNKTTIVVISANARFISAMPILLLGWVFACYEPLPFTLQMYGAPGKEKIKIKIKILS